MDTDGCQKRSDRMSKDVNARTKSQDKKSVALEWPIVSPVLMFLIAGAGGYGIHRYWVSGNLTLLQRVYFKQYMKSSWRSSLFNSKAHYTVLEKTAIDPQTKKEKRLSVLENEVVPSLDD